MEADSTATENVNEEIKDLQISSTQSDYLPDDLQSGRVQSSQITSCDEDTFSNVQSTTCINKAIENVLSITSNMLESEAEEGVVTGDMESEAEEGVVTGDMDSEADEGVVTGDMEEGSQDAFKHSNVQNIELKESSKTIENITDSKLNENDINITLTEDEHICIEESVLSKYTGLDIDLPSENQLLKEDVIKCKCELKRYGKKLNEMDRKLDEANSSNIDLQGQIDKLTNELHDYRKAKDKLYVHSDTQTTAEDLMEVDDTLYDVNLPGAKTDTDSFDWMADSDEQTTNTGGESSLQTAGMSIADSLKATAEAAMNQTGFVYDEQSGLYYDYNTGYYYNAEKGLYYDPKSGTYFYYNKSTSKYEFHSQVDLSYYAPIPHGHSDRSHGSYHHGHSDKYSSRYSDRSPEHGDNTSGKKKKKKDSKRRDSEEKESRRRSSDEKEHKKQKRKKDKSRDNSEDSDDEKKNKKKRKTEDKASAIIDEINKKIEDRANIVVGELNYKKLKQGDKLLHDSLKKPKLLKEDQANVSICEDVEKEKETKPSSGMGLGCKKIKLVLKKKEKTDEKEESQSKEDDKKDEAKNTENLSENINELTETSTVSSDDKVTEKNEDVNSTSSNLDQQLNIATTHSDSENTDKLKELESGANSPRELQKDSDTESDEHKSEEEGDNSVNPFAITGLDVDDETLNYEKVGIVNNEEILRICAELNNQDTDDEDDDKKNSQKQASVSVAENSENTDQDMTTDDKNVTENKENDNQMEREVLGVGENAFFSKISGLGNKIKEIPIKRGEENIYSDDDDIMIIEKEEEKIMIDLDSDDSEAGKEATSYNLPGLEPGELVSSSSSSSSSSLSTEEQVALVNAPWVELVAKPTPASEETLLKNAPCIRAMVTASDILDEGMLFIITIKGGMIGREPRPDLVIPVPDVNVSKVHAEIRYNKKKQLYSIQDKGSQNGTFVNETRISETKKVSNWIELKHEDTLQFSCTRFDLHIHPGTDTCNRCEPGLVVQPQDNQSTDKRIQLSHKQQLKNIKKKYGLANSSYTDNASAINNPAYKDKASERRRTVGSDNPHLLDDRPASVHRSIEEDNKGHKLLKKLGWSEGKSLGKDNTGIQQPIDIVLRVDQSAGLGALGKANEMSISNVGVANARRRFIRSQMRHINSGTSDSNKVYEPKIWVQGESLDNDILINEGNNKIQ